METNDKIRQRRLMKKFVEDYQSYYDELELSYLKDNLEIEPSDRNIPDILRQILCELNFLKDEDNIYLHFSNLIEQLFGLDKHIIEIGGGVIPSLSKIIALRQKDGSITVYDPRLITESTSSNLILKKEKFDMKTITSNCDLLVGFMPKDATEIIINKACLEKKDFIITLCSDGLSDEDDYYEDNEEFVHSIICNATRRVTENSLGMLEKTYLKSLGPAYPIIYNKR